MAARGAGLKGNSRQKRNNKLPMKLQKQTNNVSREKQNKDVRQTIENETRSA
jgi:hypothetical protein